MKVVNIKSLITFCVVSIVCVTPQQNACGSGWFGANCQYKCRCSNNNCDINGLCLGNDACKGGWFGPACQYVDLAFGRASVSELTDGNDDTCSAYNDTTNSVFINLDEPYTFTWLRVHGTNNESLVGLQVTFDNGVGCNNPRNVTVDDRTLDIYCSNDEMVQFVTLTGPRVSSLCSVYISGGRNVAVRETAQQSSTYITWVNGQQMPFVANLSVDGDSNPHFFQGLSCSLTNGGGQLPDQWNISFSRVRIVNRYIVYGRTDGNWDRLQGFRLQSYAGTNLVNDYTAQQQTSAVYKVKHDNRKVSFVQIISGSNDKVLQMCEMEIYGDSDCQDGKYGRECEHTCNCEGDKPCFPSTGGCPSGCAAGFQGNDCNKPCSPGRHGPGCLADCNLLCAKDTTNVRTCDSVSGACHLGCEGGYRGSHCNLTCEQNKYGKDCNQTCSEHCANKTVEETSCHPVNGSCNHGCDNGYQEPLCSSRMVAGCRSSTSSCSLVESFGCSSASFSSSGSSCLSLLVVCPLVVVRQFLIHFELSSPLLIARPFLVV
ncbi:unnamed protein product, partial [Candidula unifasciata]